MDVLTLRAIDLEPGMVRENITTEGLEVMGRRGMLCRVLRGGTVKPGDPIDLRG